MRIDNKISNTIVEIFSQYQINVIGSFSRNPEQKSYKELEFVTACSLDDVIYIASSHFSNVEVIKKEDHFISFKIGEKKYQINVWKTEPHKYDEVFKLIHLSN